MFRLASQKTLATKPVCRSVCRSVAVFFIWVCRCSVLRRWAGALFRPALPVYMYYCSVQLYSTTTCMYAGGVGVYSVYSAKRPHVDRRSGRGHAPACRTSVRARSSARMLNASPNAAKRPHVGRRSGRGQAPARWTLVRTRPSARNLANGQNAAKRPHVTPPSSSLIVARRSPRRCSKREYKAPIDAWYDSF